MNKLFFNYINKNFLKHRFDITYITRLGHIIIIKTINNLIVIFSLLLIIYLWYYNYILINENNWKIISLIFKVLIIIYIVNILYVILFKENKIYNLVKFISSIVIFLLNSSILCLCLDINNIDNNYGLLNYNILFISFTLSINIISIILKKKNKKIIFSSILTYPWVFIILFFIINIIPLKKNKNYNKKIIIIYKFILLQIENYLYLKFNSSKNI